VSYMRCHKKMNDDKKCLVEKFEQEGIPRGKLLQFSIMVIQISPIKIVGIILEIYEVEI